MKQYYVGLKTNLRKPAVLLFARRRGHAWRIDVRKPLALADDLLCRRARLPGCGPGRAAEAS